MSQGSFWAVVSNRSRFEPGKPGSPCVRGGVQYATTAHRSLLPVSVRASGSESDVSSTQKEEWFV
ncbi:hypothetical protein SK128_028602 [Halocaridina rubra]|uniref:Uncharacterized protein n=1 Tax=Halocaridina rubra TaxID=373956 RepID=A0AAN9FTM8_HALRR